MEEDGRAWDAEGGGAVGRSRDEESKILEFEYGVGAWGGGRCRIGNGIVGAAMRVFLSMPHCKFGLTYFG